MKKISIILLTAIILLQSGGLLLFYLLEQRSVKTEMKAQIVKKETQFERLTLSLTDYKKSIIDAHEIRFLGKMYDVKEVEINGDKVELLVLCDNRETQILAQIQNQSSENTSSQKSLPNKLNKILYLDYLLPDKEALQQNFFAGKAQYPTVSILLKDQSLELISPPPELG